MENIFTLDNLVTLGMLTLLQAVLGFDNLLYITLESKRAPAHQQVPVRRWAIGIAMFFRIALLITLLKVITYFQNPVIEIHTHLIAGAFTLHSMIVLLGGAFIIYTAMKEIFHMMQAQHLESHDQKPRSAGSVIAAMVVMNLVFSFDSILSAMALTKVIWVMTLAIVIGAVLMLWLSDRVAVFLEKNRMYEVLGLFILFVVGIMLLTEGGHLAHMHLLGNEITVMSKTTFYFVIAVLVLTDVVQGRYQKRILAQAKA